MLYPESVKFQRSFSVTRDDARGQRGTLKEATRRSCEVLEALERDPGNPAGRRGWRGSSAGQDPSFWSGRVRLSVVYGS